jgi:uncharacterized OB-fold protein
MPRPRTLKTPLADRSCKNCGTSYVPYRSWQEFCKPSCRFQFYWKTHDMVDGETVKTETAVPVQTTQPTT